MRAKILLAAGTVLAFVLGTMASGIYTATSRAFNPVEEKVISPTETAKSTVPVSRTHLVQPKTVYVSNTPAAAPVYQSHRKRSLGREALIVGGSAGAGAAIGAVAGGGKGAGIGAVSGGIAGLIYDLATRTNNDQKFRAGAFRIGEKASFHGPDSEFPARNTKTYDSKNCLFDDNTDCGSFAGCV